MNLNLNYAIPDGAIIRDDGMLVVPAGHAWAGHDVPGGVQGRNNPDAVQDVAVGPLPPGVYRVGEWAFTPEDSIRLGYPAHLGLIIASLTQIDGDTFGRNGFFMHGPGGADPRESSKGCIEVEHSYRIQVAAMKPDTITVNA